MKRIDFLKTSLVTSLGAITLGKAHADHRKKTENRISASISKVNDRNVENLLHRTQQFAESHHHRSQSGFILALSAAFCSTYSDYFHSDVLVDSMHQVGENLLHIQNPDGTFDSGNLQSPPDSGFSTEQLFRAQSILEMDDSAQSTELRETVKEIILKTCEALLTGGVHTPNHRWVICAALAGTYSLYPDQRYVDRINDWLGEGFGQDEDGEHPERSRNYDASVNNPSLLDVAIYQERPELLEYIRKNLEMTIYLFELNGEVETVSSRRQDQWRSYMVHRYYVPYRYMAIRDQNPIFAWVARFIEEKYMDTLGDHLADFMLHPELDTPLPEPIPLPDNYVKHFRNTKMARIRRERTTATVFGGTDWHLGHGVWSGLSTNPAFFKFRKGEAILESVRMSPRFFSTGFFRSNGLTVEGNEYYLQEERRVPYHQPLPDKYRNKDGLYKLSPDGRFFSKMDFENRPKDYVNLRSRVNIRELTDKGTFELEFLVDETENVAVTIELCFRKGGELSGVIPRENDPDGFFLRDGYGSYKVGRDTVEFGPGMMKHIHGPQVNEQYTVHNGGLDQEGYRIYITGFTPLKYQLKIG